MGLCGSRCEAGQAGVLARPAAVAGLGTGGGMLGRAREWAGGAAVLALLGQGGRLMEGGSAGPKEKKREMKFSLYDLVI